MSYDASAEADPSASPELPLEIISDILSIAIEDDRTEIQTLWSQQLYERVQTYVVYPHAPTILQALEHCADLWNIARTKERELWQHLYIQISPPPPDDPRFGSPVWGTENFWSTDTEESGDEDDLGHAADTVHTDWPTSDRPPTPDPEEELATAFQRSLHHDLHVHVDIRALYKSATRVLNLIGTQASRLHTLAILGVEYMPANLAAIDCAVLEHLELVWVGGSSHEGGTIGTQLERVAQWLGPALSSVPSLSIEGYYCAWITPGAASSTASTAWLARIGAWNITCLQVRDEEADAPVWRTVLQNIASLRTAHLASVQRGSAHALPFVADIDLAPFACPHLEYLVLHTQCISIQHLLMSGSFPALSSLHVEAADDRSFVAHFSSDVAAADWTSSRLVAAFVHMPSLTHLTLSRQRIEEALLLTVLPGLPTLLDLTIVGLAENTVEREPNDEMEDAWARSTDTTKYSVGTHLLHAIRYSHILPALRRLRLGPCSFNPSVAIYDTLLAFADHHLLMDITSPCCDNHLLGDLASRVKLLRTAFRTIHSGVRQFRFENRALTKLPLRRFDG